MTDSMRSQLEQAYQLIQQDQLDEALQILRPLTQQEPDNPDAWWLLANAVSEPEDAYEALTNVLRLEPGHGQARELLDNLLAEFPELGASTRPVPATGLDDEKKRSTDEWGEPLEAGASLEANIDEMFGEGDTGGVPQPAAAGSSDYKLESFFSPDADEADDLDDLFKSSGVKTVPAISSEESDLDALFGAKESSRRSADALSDPFGASEPDFLEAAVAPPADAKRATGPARRTQTATTTAAAAPQTRRGSRAWLWLIPLLALLGIGAWWVLTNAPTNQVAVNATPSLLAPTFDVTGQAAATATALIDAANATAVSSDATLKALSSTAVPAETATAEIAPATAENMDATPADPMATLVSATQDLFVSKGFNNPTAAVKDEQLVVSTCDVPGRTLQGRFLEAMQLVAQQAAGSRDALKSVAVELVQCNTKGVLYRASAAISDVIAFVDGGGTDVNSFRASWKE